jgi:hypothetical protein
MDCERKFKRFFVTVQVWRGLRTFPVLRRFTLAKGRIVTHFPEFVKFAGLFVSLRRFPAFNVNAGILFLAGFLPYGYFTRFAIRNIV